MSTDLQLKASCGGCGSSTDLYGSSCKHMTLCLTCGKTMAENNAKCFDCGATITRLIREINLRASSTTDKNYSIGRFETKPTVKEENGSASKSNAPSKGASPAPSSKAGSSSAVSGPVSEEEIRAVLMQNTPVTTQDLVFKFKARLRSPEDKKAFAEILKRIAMIRKTNGSSYLILRERSHWDKEAITTLALLFEKL